MGSLGLLPYFHAAGTQGEALSQHKPISLVVNNLFLAYFGLVMTVPAAPRHNSGDTMAQEHWIQTSLFQVDECLAA